MKGVKGMYLFPPSFFSISFLLCGTSFALLDGEAMPVLLLLLVRCIVLFIVRQSLAVQRIHQTP